MTEQRWPTITERGRFATGVRAQMSTGPSGRSAVVAVQQPTESFMEDHVTDAVVSENTADLPGRLAGGLAGGVRRFAQSTAWSWPSRVMTDQDALHNSLGYEERLDRSTSAGVSQSVRRPWAQPGGDGLFADTECDAARALVRRHGRHGDWIERNDGPQSGLRG